MSRLRVSTMAAFSMLALLGAPVARAAEPNPPLAPPATPAPAAQPAPPAAAPPAATAPLPPPPPTAIAPAAAPSSAPPPPPPPPPPGTAAPGALPPSPYAAYAPPYQPAYRREAPRPYGISGEAGWNGLVGVGPQFHIYAVEHFAFDLGFGVSALGLKAGARARYLFLTDGHTTPFLGLGLLESTGSGATAVELNTDNNVVHYKIHATPFLQYTGGLDYHGDGGFMFMAAIGYAQRLGGENVEIVDGTPTTAQNRGFDTVYRSGIVISLNFGYRF